MLLEKLILCSLTAAWAWANEEILLDTSLGTLKGLKTTTALHKKPFYSFKGIPYAKPLIDRNKFEFSQSVEPWDGVYDATSHRSTCTFFCLLRQQIVGDDDCLYLNVYTPNMDKTARKAVMVWFHGGGFNLGSGDDDLFGPDYLVEHDVVIVTINYRLGPLGFLNTRDANAPGNAGLKDQVTALKWIHDNIETFGGCPLRVTIMGTSAGGASVQFHMMSSMSQGLFANAIQQSGSTISPWSITYAPVEAAFTLGKALGIDTTDTAELVDKLKDIPTKKIIEACAELDNNNDNMITGRIHLFVPSIEVDVGQEIFLSTDPWELIKAGKVADVPYLIGVNSDEGMFLRNAMLQLADYMNEHFSKFVPHGLNITDPVRTEEIAKSMRKFYFNDKPISKDTEQEYSNMASDLMIIYGTALPLKIINSYHSKPIYYYLFSYETPNGFLKSFDAFSTDKGVAHGDEMWYEFYSRFLNNLPQPGSPGEKVTNAFIKMWTNFAKDSNPTSILDDDVTINWEPLGKEDNYMNINEQLRMEKDLFKDRVNFWVQLYKDILGDSIKLFN